MRSLPSLVLVRGAAMVSECEEGGEERGSSRRRQQEERAQVAPVNAAS